MRTLTTIAALTALAWPLPAIPAAAQEEATVTEALEALEREKAGTPAWNRPYHPARAILRQRYGPRSAAGLDGFADRVAAMMADATLPEHVRSNAKSALLGAASSEEPHLGGTPYPRAFELLVRVYEGGTYDGALFTIWLADDVRGPAYVRDVFERSERPPLCPYPPTTTPANARHTPQNAWLGNARSTRRLGARRADSCTGTRPARIGTVRRG